MQIFKFYFIFKGILNIYNQKNYFFFINDESILFLDESSLIDN